MFTKEFYKGKKVLVTGHTGFKGSWLCRILIECGAEVVGYSLNPPTEPSLFELSKIAEGMVSIIGDIRDYDKLKSVFDTYRPELVFHLAAQPIVRESYVDPKYTFDVNVMGTVNILECLRTADYVRSFLNVTTDKVYENNDIYDHAFSEDEKLDGFDPYSNSKSCSELVTHSYKKSFFKERNIAISTARAGNVIGGGDFAKDRIIPDAIRAIEKRENVLLRNPNSTRPYQHVLEPLAVYLDIVEGQYNNPELAGYYNVGPDDEDCVSTKDLMTLFCTKWNTDFTWYTKEIAGPHEANFLKLNCNLIKKVFGWKPVWHIGEAINKIVEWNKVYMNDINSIPEEMDREIMAFLEKRSDIK